MNQEIKLSIPTMKCSGCTSAVVKALEESGVTDVKMDLERKSASFRTHVPVNLLIDTIKAVGFDATEKRSERRDFT